MRINADLKRAFGLVVGIVCAGTLAACAAGTSPTFDNSSAEDQASHDMALDRHSARTAEDKVVSNILKENQSGFTYSLDQVAGINQFKLANTAGKLNYSISKLESPDRLVVDVKGLKVRESVNSAAQNSDLVEKVRLGSRNQNDGRIVLDLNGPATYTVNESADSITVNLAKAGAGDLLAKNEVKAPEAALSETKLPETKAATEVAVASAVKEIKQANNLKSIVIQNAGAGENYLVAQLDQTGKYSFEQTAPSEYVLRLNDVKTAEAVSKALVSQAGKGAVRSVRVVETGSDVELRIFSQYGTDLAAHNEGSAIYVTAKTQQSIDANKLMAQAEPEAAPEVKEAAAEEATAGDGEDLSDLFDNEQQYTGRLISLDLQDTEIDNALRIIAEVSNLNIIASDDVTGKVTLRLIDVPWDQALDVILKTNGLDKVQEGNVVRIAPVEKLRAEREALRQAQQAEDELTPLRVQYMRISYAKSADLQPLVETVLTERGSVTYDERSNQLIVKDIDKGIKNAAKLVKKLDLRTPQVLIETQIVEAQKTFVRELGSELGFYYIRSPETGNATGNNFPNSIAIGGTAVDSSGDDPVSVRPTGSFFPASNAASAVSALFTSADGSKGLNVRLSQAETEGRVRVVSRPSVAVTNNSPAVIKSVEKLRIKLPSGGVSVATGQGANAAGGGSVATETIEIGIVLNVTAQASPDYYVLLDINAKSSTLGPQSDAVDEIPPEIERSATSSVLVSSGQTFAMGGIYRITEDQDLDGVPFLKDIPVLGHFFRRSGLSDIDEELIFFITPRIIEGSFDDAAMKAVS